MHDAIELLTENQHQHPQTMANLTKEAKAFMNGLFNDYGLSMDDIFRHQHFTIIKLSGINKIMAKAGITSPMLWKAVMPSTLL